MSFALLNGVTIQGSGENMFSTLPKTRNSFQIKTKPSRPVPGPMGLPSPEDCFFQFAQSLKNIGEFPMHWLNTFRIQSSDMKLIRTLRVGGKEGIACVIRTSPRLEDYLQENAQPLARVGSSLFDRLGVDFTQRMAHLSLGTTLMVAPEIQPGMPKELSNREPDVLCKILIDVTFLEIMLFREPLTRR